jgi:hypothetical protein
MPGKRAAALEAIQEPWLQLHPQVVVERDRILRAVGTQTLAEREQWLNKVGALKDEWIIERKVQLLIDKGEIQNARQLLLSVSFQIVHQTYTRTGMCCKSVKGWENRAIRFRKSLEKIVWPDLAPTASSSSYYTSRRLRLLTHSPTTVSGEKSLREQH